MEQVRATLRDVAKKSGYALRTVKKVMGGTESVAEKTRAEVLQAAVELNYQRNLLASTLSKGRVRRVAIVYSETTKAYFPEVQRGFAQCAEDLRDYGLEIEFHKNFDRDADRQIDIFNEIIGGTAAGGGIDGLIVQPMSQTRLNPYIDRLTELGKPVITFGADAPSSSRLCYIGPDAYKSGRIGAQILANYIGKSGHVAVISDNNEHMQTINRIRGFADRVREHYPEIEVTNLNIPLNSSLYYELVKTIVTNESYKGIFCTDANSYIAGEVLRDLGARDTAVVGFDISQTAAELMRQGYVKVIIEQNPYQFSYSALRIMFKRLYLGLLPEKIQHTPLSILTSECLE